LQETESRRWWWWRCDGEKGTHLLDAIWSASVMLSKSGGDEKERERESGGGKEERRREGVGGRVEKECGGGWCAGRKGKLIVDEKVGQGLTDRWWSVRATK